MYCFEEDTACSFRFVLKKCDFVCVRVCVCVRVWVRVRVCACVCV